MYRQAVSSDLPGIISLWETVFEDTEAWIRDFFSAFPSCISYIYEEDGQVLSMAHVLPTVLTPDRLCGYFYAVATDPQARGRGLCRALMTFAEQDLQRRGICLTALHPAEPSLFAYYERLGYRTIFTRSHTRFTGGTPISAAEYLSRRETLLMGPHIFHDLHLLQFAQKCYHLTFYETPTGIAAASPSYTAEVLPEDLGGSPCAMGKWLTKSEPLSGCYLGFPLE